MKQSSKTVIGIDVGGSGKGFHAVALRKGQFEPQHFTKAEDMSLWSKDRKAQIIAIDAPCAWASSGGSRLAERSLTIGGKTIQCFKTPTRISAEGRNFYRWVFNGEKLYQSLLPHYHLFDGSKRKGKIVLETFPHAVACALEGCVLQTRRKASARRRILQQQGYDDAPLTNIDFVDAAMCALTAERFLLGSTISFGDQTEGFIVLPG